MAEKKLPCSEEKLREIVAQYGTPFHIYDEKGINLEVIRQTLELPPDTPLVPFSAEKGDGKTEVLSLLSQFFA